MPIDVPTQVEFEKLVAEMQEATESLATGIAANKGEIARLENRVGILEGGTPEPPTPPTDDLELVEGPIMLSNGDIFKNKRMVVKEGAGLLCERDADVMVSNVEILLEPTKSGTRGMLFNNGGKIDLLGVKVYEELDDRPYSPYDDLDLIKAEGCREFYLDGFQLHGGTKGVHLRSSLERPLLKHYEVTNGEIGNCRDAFNDDWPIEGHHFQALATHKDKTPPWVGTPNSPMIGGLIENVKFFRDANKYAGADDINCYHGGEHNVILSSFSGQRQRSAAHVQFERCWKGTAAYCDSYGAMQNAFSWTGTQHCVFGNLRILERIASNPYYGISPSAWPNLPAIQIRSYRGTSIRDENIKQIGPIFADGGPNLVDLYMPDNDNSLVAVQRV